MNSKTTDLLAVWPDNVDFPHFRYWLAKNAAFFNEIYMVFSTSHKPKNIRHEIKALFPKKVQGIHVIDRPGDWRHNAVTDGLARCKSDRILFIEQDVHIENKLLYNLLTQHEYVTGFQEGNRLHPAFLLMNRDVLYSTSMNFAANPPIHDHFGDIVNYLDMDRVKLFDADTTEGFEHIAGLTHNYNLLISGQSPNYKVDRFIRYNQEALLLPIAQVSSFQWVLKKGSLLNAT